MEDEQGRTETCPECGEAVAALIVSNAICQWVADHEGVERLGEEYAYLSDGMVETPDYVEVMVRICPACKATMEEPWIEEPRPSDCANCASRDDRIAELESLLRRWLRKVEAKQTLGAELCTVELEIIAWAKANEGKEQMETIRKLQVEVKELKARSRRQYLYGGDRV